jgi:hypothetical protein
MTGISNEREYIRDGKVTKMVVFQLTDDRYVLFSCLVKVISMLLC